MPPKDPAYQKAKTNAKWKPHACWSEIVSINKINLYVGKIGSLSPSKTRSERASRLHRQHRPFDTSRPVYLTGTIRTAYFNQYRPIEHCSGIVEGCHAEFDCDPCLAIRCTALCTETRNTPFWHRCEHPSA